MDDQRRESEPHQPAEPLRAVLHRLTQCSVVRPHCPSFEDRNSEKDESPHPVAGELRIRGRFRNERAVHAITIRHP